MVVVYILKRNNTVMGTGEVRHGRVMGGGVNRGGWGTRGGGSRCGEINRKQAWEHSRTLNIILGQSLVYL